MKNIKIIIAIITLTFVATNFASAQFNSTQLYSGDLTTEKYQEKLNVVDAEIAKIESKKAIELETLAENYQDNLPKAPKTKKVKAPETVKETTKAPKKKAAKYSLVADLNGTTEVIDTITKPVVKKAVEEITADKNDYAKIKAEYDAKYEASKNAIAAKYDAFIEKLENQKLALIEAMANSKGNYVASTTSADKAGQLYMTISYANQLSNNSVSSTTGNNLNQPGTVMLYVHNTSKYCTVTITSAPFNGITLVPGQKSMVCLPVPIGIYSLAYNEYRNGTSRVTARTMNIPISLGGGSDLNIADR